jgi:hypothetical protein
MSLSYKSIYKIKAKTNCVNSISPPCLFIAEFFIVEITDNSKVKNRKETKVKGLNNLQPQ